MTGDLIRCGWRGMAGDDHQLLDLGLLVMLVGLGQRASGAERGRGDSAKQAGGDPAGEKR